MPQSFGTTPLYSRTLIVLFIVPMVTVFLLLSLQIYDLRANDQAAAARSAVLVARSLESVDSAHLTDWLARQVAGDDATRRVRGIVIEAPDGQPLASAGRLDESGSVVATASSPGGQRVRLALPETPRQPLWLRGLGLALLIALTSIVAYGIATWPAVQIVTSALDDMLRAVDSYRQSNFSPRLAQRGFGRILTLENKLNRMAQALAEAQRRAAQSARSTAVDLQSSLEEVEIKNVELDMARKRAVEDAQDKARFLANMSHEIRTPMNAVVGYSQLLAASSLDAAQRDYLGHIERASQTLLAIIDDILDLSRLEAGRMTFIERSFDIRQIVALVVDMLAPQAYAKGLSLRVRIGADVPASLTGDPGKIRQVLSNFLSNAVKFTDSGVVELTISISASGDDSTTLTLGVRDTGRGIDEADRQRLFEPFTQSSRRSQGGGAGLGLTIARAMTYAMGGELTLQSQPGAGSTFTATLPVTVDDGEYAFLKILRGVTVTVAVRDPSLREHLTAHLQAVGATALAADHREGATAHPDTRFVIVEHRDAAPWAPGDADAPTPLLLVPTADRKKLQSAVAETGGLALPAHASATRVLSAMARHLGADVPALTVPEQAAVLPEVKGARVLVADDDALSRQYLEDLLASHGVEVTSCSDGARAATIGESLRFDAVLLDARMPEFSGEDVTRSLRATRSNARTPILILTASALADDRQRLLDAGADDCLIKPAPIARLLGCIRRGMDQAREELARNEELSLARSPLARPELTTELRRFREALVVGNNTPEETAELAHRLRGAAAISQLPSIEERAADLEAAARARHADAMLLAMNALAITLDDTLELLAPEQTRH